MKNKKSSEEFQKEIKMTIPNIEVIGEYKNSKTPILCKCNRCGTIWNPIPSNLLRGHGCPKCQKKEGARTREANRRKQQGSFYDWCFSQGEKGISLLSQWDYEKNSGIKPTEVSKGSEGNVYWKCEKGHSWLASVAGRTAGRGCPICSNRLIVAGINDLATRYPKIAEEWDYSKNGELLPSMISYGSEKKIWWKCKQGHQWKMTPNARTFKNSGCPICSHHKLDPHYNSLLACNPELAKEWDKEKNGSLTPADVFPSSNMKVWWKCEICGHSWRMALISRTNGAICPHCNSRLKTSFPEQAIYYYVKKTYSDAIIHYTDPDFGKSELDIYIPATQTGIEYDGCAFHNTKAAEERERKKYELCKAKGIRLIRIKESVTDTYKNYCDILIETEIYHYDLKVIDALLNQLSEYVKLPAFDCEKDESKIKQSYYSIARNNSLPSVAPKLVTEWDYEKNGDLKPQMFTASSGQKVWWKCEKEHSWKAPIYSRIKGHGCPYCANILAVPGYNDLETLYPELLPEWINEINSPLVPSQTASKSSRKVWWHCFRCGNDWETTVYNRTIRKTGCPYCANVRVLAGFNDLSTTHPCLVREWDYEKNENCSPNEFVSGSTKKVWWKCSKDHSWNASIISRVRGNGCPLCSVSRRKAVMNQDTGMVYETLTEAAKECGLKSGQTISLCCQGKRELAGGYHWKYH